LGRVVVVEEEDEHGFVTSTSTATKKKNRPHHWSAPGTVTFYRSLRQCGMDFTTMSATCFADQPRTRKQLKRKFSTEQRLHPKLIEMALNRTTLSIAIMIVSTQERKCIHDMVLTIILFFHLSFSIVCVSVFTVS
jgi:hypothetical protein